MRLQRVQARRARCQRRRTFDLQRNVQGRKKRPWTSTKHIALERLRQTRFAGVGQLRTDEGRHERVRRILLEFPSKSLGLAARKRHCIGWTRLRCKPKRLNAALNVFDAIEHQHAKGCRVNFQRVRGWAAQLAEQCGFDDLFERLVQLDDTARVAPNQHHKFHALVTRTHENTRMHRAIRDVLGGSPQRGKKLVERIDAKP